MKNEFWIILLKMSQNIQEYTKMKKKISIIWLFILLQGEESVSYFITM